MFSVTWSSRPPTYTVASAFALKAVQTGYFIKVHLGSFLVWVPLTSSWPALSPHGVVGFKKNEPLSRRCRGTPPRGHPRVKMGKKSASVAAQRFPDALVFRWVKQLEGHDACEIFESVMLARDSPSQLRAVKQVWPWDKIRGRGTLKFSPSWWSGWRVMFVWVCWWRSTPGVPADIPCNALSAGKGISVTFALYSTPSYHVSACS